MKLSKLELLGFKSFAHKTQILFEPGITCVVGPNGCGKSNTVDAIKWVLGTLSHKSLRSDEWLDVIFKGAEGMSPMSFAEVSLALDNSDHTLPVEFEEVIVTRKLFSSGESEYLINKSQCRLKDIKELFYGTGIGVDTYSIIEQGKVDRLIMASSKERRLVFDEASGISKYRVRRQEAESRLESVSTDLVRLQDIAKEVEKELRSIKSQAHKAEKYKIFFDELKQKKAELAMAKYDGLFRQHQTSQAQKAEMLQLIDRYEATYKDIAADKLAEEENISKAKKLLQETEGKLGDSKSNMAITSGFLKQAQDRSSELVQDIQNLKSDKKALEDKAVLKQTELGNSTKLKEQIEKDLWKDKKLLDENCAKLQDAENECGLLNKNIEGKKAQLIELAHKKANYQNELSNVACERENGKSSIESAKVKKSALENDLRQLNEIVEEQKRSVITVSKTIEGHTASYTTQELEHKKLKSDMSAIVSAIHSLEETLAKKASSKELLTILENQLEGIDAGAKALLKYNGEVYPGILGTLADFIDVAFQNICVVESILGEKAGYLVVETAQKAQEIAEFAKSNNIGRVGLLWLNVANGNTKPVPNYKVASEFVNCDESFKKLIDNLLGSHIIVNDINEGFKLATNGDVRFSFVTNAGDIIDVNGKVAVHSNNGHTILSRKAELRRLDTEIDELNNELGDKLTERTNIEKALTASDEKLDALKHGLYESNVEKVELTKELDILLHKHSLLKDELQNIEIGIADIVSRAANLDKQEAQIKGLVEELKVLGTELNNELEDCKSKVQRYESTRADLEAERTNVKISIMQKEERIKALDGTIKTLQDDINTLSANLETVISKGENMASKMSDITKEIESKTAELEKLEQEVNTLTYKTSNMSKEIETITGVLQGLKDKSENVYKEIAVQKEKLNDITVSQTQSQFLLEQIRKEAKDDLGIDLDAEYKNTNCQEVIDKEKLESEIIAIKGELEKMGSVNMLALDRLNELSQRHNVLSEQESDLAKSREKLLELIRNLNKESREVFERTLEAVKINFNELFRKLFGGGKADIVLQMSEGNSDILEAGVEVYVKPPKKELTTLSLLSGGEKSMTSLALIMALFKVNPSPFCIMDEVDAALDETNVDKFTGLVKEFANTTQFIIITHSRRALSMADVIYGITMEQAGVSKKVAVSFSDIEGTKDKELVEAVS